MNKKNLQIEEKKLLTISAIKTDYMPIEVI